MLYAHDTIFIHIVDTASNFIVGHGAVRLSPLEIETLFEMLLLLLFVFITPNGSLNFLSFYPH